MTYRSTIIIAVMWLTRISGGVFVIGGLSCFVSAWMEHAPGLMWIGFPIITFGTFIMSVRPSATGDLEYGLFKRRA